MLEHFGGNLPYDSIVSLDHNEPSLRKRLRDEAKKYWQKKHKIQPKYDTKERTQAEFLAQIAVPVREHHAQYVQITRGGNRIGRWLDNSGQVVGAEDIAKEYYSNLGYQVLRFERQIISAWIGAFLGKVIEDQNDPLARPGMTGSSVNWKPNNPKAIQIWVNFPPDIGRAQYYKRREGDIISAMSAIAEANNLGELFDDSWGSNYNLIDYFKAANTEDILRARLTLDILPAALVIDILHWVIKDFWARRAGWPDLLVYKMNEFRFVEVKTKHDKLSQDQMNWFEWAILTQKIPCEIMKLRPLD
ncbi:MAG: VRR-NUC domain-containing protein [Candidatus Marinimicrobia bacterium]|nr:VRR-NUC domain-containing protein [Candidatus Neomarinimicrobiota bacterium]